MIGVDKRQDEDGQWWYYPPRGRRSRLYKRICRNCKKVEWVGLRWVKCRCVSCANSANRHPGWKGGKKYSSGGYVLLHKPNHPCTSEKGYIIRSRIVMEKKLGRYLTPKETMHHVNGIKDDDRIENLWLFASKGEHTSFHHFLRKRERKLSNEESYTTNHSPGAPVDA